MAGILLLFSIVMSFQTIVMSACLRIVGTSWTTLWRGWIANKESPQRRPWNECPPKFKGFFILINLSVLLIVGSLLLSVYAEVR